MSTVGYNKIAVYIHTDKINYSSIFNLKTHSSETPSLDYLHPYHSATAFIALTLSLSHTMSVVFAASGVFIRVFHPHPEFVLHVR